MEGKESRKGREGMEGIWMKMGRRNDSAAAASAATLR
jgi:hypothetical protein